jgi:acyl-CoA synthetase (AMP-forming)/AMP-acid ligase II
MFRKLWVKGLHWRSSNFCGEKIKIIRRSFASGQSQKTTGQSEIKVEIRNSSSAPSAPAKKEITLGSFILNQADRFGFRDCLRFPHENLNWNYSTVRDYGIGFAEACISYEINIGHKILYTLGNGSYNLIAQLGSASAGVRFVTSDPNPNFTQLDQLLTEVKPRTVALSANQYPVDTIWEFFPELCGLLYGGRYEFDKYPSLKFLLRDETIMLPGAVPFGHMFLLNPVYPRIKKHLKKLKGTDPVLIHTSVVDGKLQEAPFTHTQILETAKLIQEKLELVADDRILVALPFYKPKMHAIGFYSALMAGASIVVPPSLDFKTIIKYAKEYYCNTIIAVGSSFEDLRNVEDIDLSFVKKALFVDSSSDKVSDLKIKHVQTFSTD